MGRVLVPVNYLLPYTSHACLLTLEGLSAAMLCLEEPGVQEVVWVVVEVGGECVCYLACLIP